MNTRQLLAGAFAATVLIAACGGGGSSTPGDGTKTALSASVSASDGVIAVGGTSVTIVVKCTPTGVTTADQVKVAVSTATSPITCTATGTSVTVTGPASVTVTPTDASGAAIGAAVTAQITCVGTWDVVAKTCGTLKYGLETALVISSDNGDYPRWLKTNTDGTYTLSIIAFPADWAGPNMGAFPLSGCMHPKDSGLLKLKSGMWRMLCQAAIDRLYKELMFNPITGKIEKYDGSEGAYPALSQWDLLTPSDNKDPDITSKWMDGVNAIIFRKSNDGGVLRAKDKKTGVITVIPTGNIGDIIALLSTTN